MAKRLILLFLVLFLIPFISSVPPGSTLTTVERGVDIVHPETVYLKEGNNLEFNFWTYNSSDGATFTNTTLNCTVYFINSSGYNFYRLSNQAGASGLITYGKGAPLCANCWTAIVPAVNLTAQLYSYQIKCQGTNLGGYDTGFFEVTYNGIALSTSQSILYGFFFLVFVFFMVSIIFIINALPASNTQDEEGKILSISYLKYFRSSLWFVEWMLLVGLLYISSNVAFAYLPEQLFAQALFMLFRITFLLTPVILVVWIIWIFVKMFHDKQLQKLLNKGFFPQGKI